MGTALLVRHGETSWNRDGRVQGWADSRLTERGREQAAALARRVTTDYDVDYLYSSDLVRAKETAGYLSRSLDLPPGFDPGWRERNFGRLQGLSSEELFDGRSEDALAAGCARPPAVAKRPPDGESLLDVRARVVAAWSRLDAELAPGETAVVVTHSCPLQLLLGHLKGQDAADAVLNHEPTNCGLAEVRLRDGRWDIVRENA